MIKVKVQISLLSILDCEAHSSIILFLANKFEFCLKQFVKNMMQFFSQSLQNLLGVRGPHPPPTGPPQPRPPSQSNPTLPLSGIPPLRPSNSIGHHRPSPLGGHSPIHPGHSPVHGAPQGLSNSPFGLPPIGGPSPMQVCYNY